MEIVYYSNKLNKTVIIEQVDFDLIQLYDKNGLVKEFDAHSLMEYGTKNEFEYIGVL